MSSDGVEPYHCTPTYDPSDIICPGSDAEETPEETRKKRQRYEDMAKRYEKGERPMIQSASLRGPLSEESGWINPWRHRLRKPGEENNWWQPGSEDMLFTRENVMKRAAAYGLGYMSPAAALAWCKASAQAEVDLRMRDQSQGSILMSVEDDIQSDGANGSGHDSRDYDEDEYLEDYQHQRSPYEPKTEDAQASMVNNYSTPSIGQTKNNPGKGVKRVVDAEWLKGSYISKRARWDGPVMPSPTPAAGVLGHRKERRRHLPLKHGTACEIHVQKPPVSLSGFKSIRREVTMSRPVLRHGRGLLGSGSSGINSTETPAFIIEGQRTPRATISNFHRQIDDVDELQDEMQEFSSIMSSQGSRKPSRSSSRNFEERSMSDLEPDELVAITPYGERDAQTPVDYNTHSQRKCFSSNKLPTLPRNVAVNHEEERAGDVSFITEVASSSRDLEKFMFRKKRGTFVPARSELALNVIAPDGGPQLSSSPDMPIETEKYARSRKSSHSSIESSIEDYNDDLEAAPKLYPNTQKAIANIASVFTTINNEGHESDGNSPMLSKKSPLPQKLPYCLPIPQQRSSFLIRSSQITQPKDQPMFQKLPEDLESAFELPVQVTRSQNGNNISTQSFNTTPTCSRKTPAKGPRPSSKTGTPKGLLPKELSINISSAREELFSQGTSREEDDYFVTISKANMPEEFDDIDHTESDMEYEANDVDLSAKISYGDEMHQIQAALSQQCQSTSPDHSTPRPEKEQHNQEGNFNVQEPEEENNMVAPAEISSVEKENNEMNVIVEDADVKDTSPEVLKSRLAKELSPQGLITSPVSPTPRFLRFPKQAKQPGLEAAKQAPDHVNKILYSHDINGIDSTGAAASSPHKNGIQSPFAQEVFIMDGPRLDTSTDMGVTPASAAAESETSWQGCGPQSPWVTEAIELLPKFPINIEANREVSIHLSPLFLQKAPIQEGEIIRPSSVALVQELPEEGFERPKTPENGGIKAFRDLISPSPVPEHNKDSENERPTGTQLLVDAATKNPWSSSLRKPGSKRPKKRVSFGYFPMEKSVPESQELKELRRSRRSLPPPQAEKDPEDWSRTRYSPPPPSSEDDLFDGGMYRAGFVGATPKATTFSNHFNAMRKFTRLLSDEGSSPSKSSPNLGGQAEAFIAADREASTERERKILPQDSPSKHLQPRSTASDNIIWQDRHEDFHRADERSSRSPSGKAQTFASGMANFDMDAALGEMSELLEDWSVDAELKKAKDDADKERVDNGLRRRRLFGLV